MLSVYSHAKETRAAGKGLRLQLSMSILRSMLLLLRSGLLGLTAGQLSAAR